MAAFYVQRLHPMLRMDRQLRAGVDGRGQAVLLHQGSLDNACGLYCLVMALILLGEASRDEAVRLIHSRQAALRRLRRWTESVFHSGMSENDLVEAVTATTLNIEVSRGESGEHRACLSHAVNGLRAGKIVALGIESRGGAFHHWILGVGLEGLEDDRVFKSTAILILDSYAVAWPYCGFNARLSLTVPRPGARFLRYSSSTRPRSLVMVSNSVVLSRRLYE